MRVSNHTVVESLESRRLLSASAVLTDGVLLVTGTDRADVIVFSLDAGNSAQLNVRLGHETTAFDLSTIASINVNAGSGNDHIIVSEENGKITVPFQVDAGAGNDLVVTGSGNDVIVGGAGKDKIAGGAGDDQLDGGAGRDKLQGGDDNDMILGGDGKDKLVGGNGDDNLDGGNGRDAITTGAGHDDIAIDQTHGSEIKDPPADRADDVEYQLADLNLLPAQVQDISDHLAQLPQAHVKRAELQDTTVTFYYQFGDDPQVYKAIVDVSNANVELVSREISPQEVRQPAATAFEQQHPGTQVLSVFQRPHEVYDVRYRDANGVIQQTTTDQIVWSEDNAQDDTNNDGLSDPHQDGQNGDGQNGGGQNGGQNGNGQNGDGQNGGQNGNGQNGDGLNGGQNGDGQNGGAQNGDGQQNNGDPGLNGQDQNGSNGSGGAAL